MAVLMTPFLIQSDELVREVLSGDVAADLMSSLPDAGVVGVGMFPEGLRHPFGFDAAALGGPSSYDGWRRARGDIRARAPPCTRLSARRRPMTSPIRAHQVGVDSEFLLDPAGTAAGNVTFYPKVNVLVADSEVWDIAERGAATVLTKAAANTLDVDQGQCVRARRMRRARSARGGAIAAATPEDLAALEAADCVRGDGYRVPTR